MPEGTPSYNRNLDFLDTGYSNLKPINYTPSTGVFPATPAPDISPTAQLDALFSGLRESASRNNPFLNSLSINQPIRTPLDQTLRYNSPKYGFDPLNPNIENQYGDRQGTFETWKNYVLKFLATTTGAFVETLATIPKVLSTPNTESIYNNSLSNSIHDWMENLEVTLPTYQTTAQAERPISSWIPFFPGSAHNWGMLLQNLGFTAGTIAGSLVIDSGVALVTGGAGVAPLIGPQMMKAFGKLGKFYTAEAGAASTALQGVKRADQVYNAINSAVGTTKLINQFRYGLAMGTSAIAEGTFEANQTYRNIKKILTEEFIAQRGYEPTGADLKRIDEYALGGGNADLFANVALLTMTNSLVFGSLFRPRNAANRLVQGQIMEGKDVALKQGSLDIFEKIKPKKFSIIKASRPVRTAGIEGFEEGMQFAFQRTAEEYYKRKFNNESVNSVDNFFKSFGTGLNETLTTREGLENVFMGALSGAVIHASRGALERKKGINNNKNNIINSTVAILNNHRLSGLFRNTYSEAVTSDSIAKDIQKAVEENDLFQYQNFKFQQLFNFVESGIRTNRFDLRIDQLNMLKELEPNQFQSMFGINFSEENKKTVNEFVDSVINKAYDIKQSVDKVNTQFQNPYPFGSNNYMVFEEYKSQLSLDLAEFNDNKRRLGQLQSELSQMAPGVSSQDLMNLTNDKGISETVLEFQKRVDQLSDTIESFLDDKQSDFYKAQVAERSFLQKAIVDLREALDEFDEDGYRKNMYNLINFYANGKTVKPDKNISPADLNEILTKSQDAFKLVSAMDGALYHYQKLTEKKGFNKFFADVVAEYDKQDAKLEDSDPFEDDPNKRQEIVQDEIEDVVDIDENGNIIGNATVPKQSTREGLQPVTNKRKKDAGIASFIAGLNNKQGLYNWGASKEEMQNVLGLDPDTASLKELKEAAQKKLKELSVPEGFVESEEPVELPFEQQPEVKAGKSKVLKKKEGEAAVPSIEFKANPTVLYNRLYSVDFPDSKEKTNLREVIFSRTPQSVYGTLSINVVESTKGLKKGEYKPFPGFKEIYYTGFDIEINVISGGKIIGKIQPADRLVFKKQGNHIPLYELLPEDYERVTGNHPSTYSDFINQIKSYQTITDKIREDFNSGKTSYDNAEVQGLIDIVVNYGGVTYVGSEASATDIKDLKYRGKGSAILSFPMIYNKDSKSYERSTRPEILNKKELSAEQVEDVLNFVKDNLDFILQKNRRYIYLMKLPDNKFYKYSPIAARPGKATDEQLTAILKDLKTPGSQSFRSNVARINNKLKEGVYIADSRNRKGLKSKMYLSFSSTGDLYLNVFNQVMEYRGGIKVTEAKEAGNFTEFIDIINQKLTRLAARDSKFDRLNIRLDKKDFSKGILNDAEVTLGQLENNLTVAVPAFPFDNFAIQVFPKSGTKPKPKPKKEKAPKPPVTAKSMTTLNPQEQEIFDAVSANLDKIKGEYGTGIKALIDDPKNHQDIVTSIVAQYVNNWEVARSTFGKEVSDAIVKHVPSAAKAESENIKTFQVAKDAKGLQEIFKSLFGLNARQAAAVAEIYDRTAESWTLRTGLTKEDFYKKLTFEKVNQKPVGENILEQLEPEPLVRQLFRSRNFEPIGNTFITDKVARERFKIDALKREALIGRGSDRDVYDIGDGKVVKIAKTARGLAQNDAENDSELVAAGIIPKVYEVGLNYLIVEKVQPADIYEYDIEQMGDNKWYVVGVNEFAQLEDPDNEIVIPAKSKADALKKKKELNEGNVVKNMLSEMKAARLAIRMKTKAKDFTKMPPLTEPELDILRKYGLNADVISQYGIGPGDFTHIENWGIKDGKPIHLDGGTFNIAELIKEYRGKSDLEDKDFREIWERSRELARKFHDHDQYANPLLYQKNITFQKIVNKINKIRKNDLIKDIEKIIKEESGLTIGNFKRVADETIILSEDDALRELQKKDEDLYSLVILRKDLKSNKQLKLAAILYTLEGKFYKSHVADLLNKYGITKAEVEVFYTEGLAMVTGDKVFISDLPDTLLFQRGPYLSNSAMIANVVKGFELVRADGFNLSYKTKTGSATPNLANKINKWLADNGYSNIRFVYEATYGTINPFVKEENLLFQNADDILKDVRNIIVEHFNKKGISRILLNKFKNDKETRKERLDIMSKSNSFDVEALKIFHYADELLKEGATFDRFINSLEGNLDYYQNYVLFKIITNSEKLEVDINRVTEKLIDDLKEDKIVFFRDEYGNIHLPDDEYYLEESEDRAVGKRPKRRLKKQLKKGNLNFLNAIPEIIEDYGVFGSKLRRATNKYLLNQQAKGAIRLMDDGSAIIYAMTNPDVSTPLHELAHFWERLLTEEERNDVLEWAGTGEEWSVETSEKFARGFEKYLAEGKAPSKGLQKIFDNFKKWLKEVYKVIIGSAIDLQLNDEMRKIYAAMLGENFESEVKAEVAKEEVAAVKEEETKETEPVQPTGEITREDVSLSPTPDLAIEIKLGDAVIDTVDKLGNKWYSADGVLEGDTREEAVEKVIDRHNAENAPESQAAEVFTKEDEGSKVIYQGKELTVQEVVVTGSGNTLVVITDGTKYGDFQVTPDKLTKVLPIVEQPVFDEGVLKDLAVKDYVDEEAVTESEEDVDNLIIDYTGLKLILENLKNRFNIPYTVVSEEGNWRGRFKDGVVIININNVRRDTPFHEYLHPFLAVMKVDNPALYKSIKDDIKRLNLENDELLDEVANEIKRDGFYKDRAKDEQEDEIIVSMISRLAARNVTKEAKSLKSQIKRAYDSIMSKIRGWLNYVIEGFSYKPDVVKEQGLDLRNPMHKAGYVKDASKAGITDVRSLPENLNIQDLADLLSLHAVAFDMSARNDLISKMDEFQAVATTTEESAIIARIRRRLAVLEDTARRRTPSDILMSEVVAVKGILKNTDEIESVNNYVEHGLHALDFANDEFKRLSKKLEEGKLTQKDILELNRSLALIKNILAFYDDVSFLFHRIVEGMDPKDYKHFSQVLNQANNNAKYIRTKSVDLITEWLYPHVEEFNEKIEKKYPEYVLTKEQFRNRLFSADQDSNFLFYWLGSVSSSSDPVSAVTRTALFDVMEENHLYEAELGESIKITYEEFLKDRGLKNEINQTEDYYKKNFLRKATVLQRTDEKDKDDKFIYKYFQKWAFHEEYFYDLYVKEKTDFLESLGERPDEAEEAEYQAWVDKIFAWEKVNGSLSKPADRFKNPAFERLYKKDAMFTKLYDTYKEANAKLGEDEALKYGVVPQVSRGRHAFTDLKKGDVKSTLKEIKGRIVNFIMPKVEDESTFAENQENLDGTIYKKITIPYTRPLDEEDINLALPETMFKYAGAVNLASLMREVEPNVVTLRSILEGNSKFIKEARKINQVTSDRKTIFDHILKLPARKEDRITRLNKQLATWIDDAVYGITELQDSINIGKRPIDLNVLGGNLAFLTALNNMAFNITAGISNVTIGNVNSFGEALGGKYYAPGDWTKATGQYFGNTKDFMKDAFRLRKSKITQLGIKYDAIQGEFRDKYGKRFVGNVAQRYATADTIFFINHIAEHQIQLTGMLALMNATKVKTTSGQIISLYDAHVIDDKGFLRLRKDIEWTAEQEKSFTRRLHGINKMLNGNYSKFDKVHLQRTWFGKLLLIYRKFIYNSFRIRYGRRRPDYEIGDVMEGYYRKFFNKLSSDIKDYKFEAARKFYKREGWSDDEKYAANKTLYELSILIGLGILTIGLAAAEDDEDKSWGQNYLALMGLRLRNDIGMYSVFGMTDIVNVVQNPSAVILTLKRYSQFIAQLVSNPFETYDRKTGAFDKGDSILKAKFLKALPIIRQFINLMQPEEQKKFFQLLNKY